MKRYCIKGQPGNIEYLDILDEKEDGFIIRVTRIRGGYEKILEEFISRHLFEICLKTGFISLLEEKTSSVA
ncbi:MAG: hypothetical protein LBQ14_11070 [Treponema sp.]|jgi:hypothetical protein|nr:hypothetical protein [Treponema sp.]